jgi:uncharacterized protein (TIGR02145 family)
VVIKMIANAGDMTDADGNVYQSVRIGNQVWMTENLRVTKYNDGTAIPLDTSSSTWNADETPKYCHYNNTTNADSIKKYGALYNWFVVSPTNAKKIAPAGWHVPTDAEWDTLENYLIANGYNWDGSITGNKIAKAMAAQSDWYTNTTTTGTPVCDLTKNNSSGFSALPGGGRYSERSNTGFFGGLPGGGHWWSATEFDASTAYCRHLWSSTEDLSRDMTSDGNYGNERWGFSVRLLRDLN